jgi:hypothetical protein
MSIIGLSKIINSNTELADIEFFYISKETKIIPWYNVFTFNFIKINKQTYVYNYRFALLIEYFNTNKIVLPQHNNTIVLDKAIFITTYEFNVGHMLDLIMQYINYILDNNLNDYKIVITQDIINISPFFLKSIIYLLLDCKNVIIIDDNTLVKCNTTQIIMLNNQCIFDEYNYLIKKLKSKVNITNKYENICLLKLDITKNANPVNKTFNIEYVKFFEANGFTLIIPENYDIVDLFDILYNSKNIILTWGCCAYLNSLFLNSTSNVLILCHSGYKNEWFSMTEQQIFKIFNSRFFPNKCNKKLILYDLPTELTDNVKDVLILEIKNLLK